MHGLPKLDKIYILITPLSTSKGIEKRRASHYSIVFDQEYNGVMRCP
jgi:hypothetical protein